MPARIQYRTLCTVNLWHDYALARGLSEFAALEPLLRRRILEDYSIHQWLRIVPTTETLQLLDRHRLRFLLRPAGFAVAASVLPSPVAPDKQVLETPLPDDFTLRFAVEIARPSFLWEANLPGYAARTSILLLDNRSGNAAGGELHLTRSVADFDASRAYEAGDLAVHQNVLMEAVEDVGPAAAPGAGKWLDLPAPRFDAAHAYQRDDLVFHEGSVFKAIADGSLPEPPDDDAWLELYGANPRVGVSSADVVAGIGRETRFDLPEPIALVTITVRDRENQVVLSDTQFRADGKKLHEIRLALPTAAPGLYAVEAVDSDGDPVPSIPAAAYLHPAEDGRLPFAVIELTQSTGAFRLFDSHGQLRNPEYHVRFRQRRAFWRYIFHGDTSALPGTPGGDLVKESATRFATTRPFPINAGVTLLKKFGGNRFLPNPSPNSIRKENKRLYAETYLTT